MRKGQAAMEFLMTYGWILLIFVAILSALAYAGVFSPDRFASDRCTAEPPFACTGYKVDGAAASDNVILYVQNGGSDDFSYLNVSLTCSDGSEAAFISGPTEGVAAGQTVTAHFTCPQPVSGQRWKGNFTISSIRADETVSHDASGTIAVMAE